MNDVWKLQATCLILSRLDDIAKTEDPREEVVTTINEASRLVAQLAAWYSTKLAS
jgi:hypothetical protein